MLKRISNHHRHFLVVFSNLIAPVADTLPTSGEEEQKGHNLLSPSTLDSASSLVTLLVVKLL